MGSLVQKAKWCISIAPVLCALIAFAGCANLGPDSNVSEHWPAYTPDPSWQPLVKAAVAEYTALGITYKPSLQNYTASGDYLNFSKDTWIESTSLHFDSDGVPLVNYKGQFYYNPVTIAQFSLSMYGKYIRGDIPTPDLFFAGVIRLILLQDDHGAFLYPYSWSYYLSIQPYPPGWVSSMAQGQCLSVLARAYQLSGDPKYLQAGNSAFNFLMTSTSQGGVADTMADLDPTLRHRLIFEEYVVQPPSHTLNGFMFTLLGVYDWSKTPGVLAPIAASAFRHGIGTLNHILPYYDIGGFTAYDMSHIIYHREPHIGVSYHAVHIYLLHALASITQDPELSAYEKLWESYVPQ